MQTRWSRSFQKWNYTTACCFKFKTHCVDCPNHVVCKLYADASKNPYHIHPIKYATLMTYSNIGTEGLEETLVKGFKQIELDNKQSKYLELFGLLSDRFYSNKKLMNTQKDCSFWEGYLVNFLQDNNIWLTELDLKAIKNTRKYLESR